MTPWDVASAAIDRAFNDPEPIIYTGAGLVGAPLAAIRSDTAAPAFNGAGKTLRTITYEVRQADLPEQPRKSNTFTHRGHLWRVEDITRRDDIGKWELVVTDGGPTTP